MRLQILLRMPHPERPTSRGQINVVNWNDRGELLYNGKPMSGTHAVDLINDFLRKRKHFNPTGWREFAQVMSGLNVPQDLVGNRDRWLWMQSKGEQAFKPVKRLKKVMSTPLKPRHGPRQHTWTVY